MFGNWIVLGISGSLFLSLVVLLLFGTQSVADENGVGGFFKSALARRCMTGILSVSTLAFGTSLCLSPIFGLWIFSLILFVVPIFYVMFARIKGGFWKRTGKSFSTILLPAWSISAAAIVYAAHATTMQSTVLWGICGGLLFFAMFLVLGKILLAKQPDKKNVAWSI